MSEQNNCPICRKTDVEKYPDHKNNVVYVMCPICGAFAITAGFFTKDKKDINSIASFLYYKLNVQKNLTKYSSCFLGTAEEYEKLKGDYGKEHLVTEKEIAAFLPKNFAGRIDKILLALSYKSKYFGDELKLSGEETCSLLFAKRYDENGLLLHNAKTKIEKQVREMLNYLEEKNYISSKNGFEGGYLITLLGDGWKRVEQIERSDEFNKNVFVSMSFAKEMDPVRKAIKKGITDAGFSAEFLDEIIHNRQIIPEMFRLIRECRFLIMDISDPNYGAYYEAGYAQGLGKEVIITCSNETFNREYKTKTEKKYARYLKPHFDILQKQILRWDDYADLTHKLTEWIKALF